MLQSRKGKGIVVILSDECLTGDYLEKESYQVLILDKLLNIQLEGKGILVILSEESPPGDSSEKEPRSVMTVCCNF